MHLFTSTASQQGTSVSFSYGYALTLIASTGQYPSGYSAYSALKLKFNLFNPFSFNRPTLRCRELWGVQGVLQAKHQEAAGLQLQAEQGVRGHQARQEQVCHHFFTVCLFCLCQYLICLSSCMSFCFFVVCLFPSACPPCLSLSLPVFPVVSQSVCLSFCLSWLSLCLCLSASFFQVRL